MPAVDKDGLGNREYQAAAVRICKIKMKGIMLRIYPCIHIGS